jgi:hypothetical protein
LSSQNDNVITDEVSSEATNENNVSDEH